MGALDAPLAYDSGEVSQAWKVERAAFSSRHRKATPWVVVILARRADKYRKFKG
jgi:hypothetical protein